jgi:hypothetical protein
MVYGVYIVIGAKLIMRRTYLLYMCNGGGYEKYAYEKARIP